ncbi:MAG: hypothetical protein NWF07_11545 [Candidatus Bathyarchaeota archaeon]|nr:hypothetical protein [Candidatus Bathyarchaeota archaeon]
MGDYVRILVLDDDIQRVEQLKEHLSKQDPDLKLDHTKDIVSFIHLVETNSYDCVLSSESNLLSKTELTSKIIELIRVPRITYLGDTRLPESTQRNHETLKEQNSQSYQVLANRIRKTVSKKQNETSYLPEHPKVVVRGEEIFIVNDDGTETSWGTESIDEIHRIAENMDADLKSIQWVRDEIELCISEITTLLSHSGLPEEDIADLIFEGYRSVLVRFKRFDSSFNGR